MSNLPIFDIAGSALQAQSVRMSTIASNLSNADTVAGSADAVYKPLEPIFQAVTSKDDPNITSVKVKEITQSEAAPIKRYEPGHRWPTPTATSTSPTSIRSHRWST